MKTKALATKEQHALAERTGSAITPMQEIGREIALRPVGDEEYRFSMRKLGNLHLGVRLKTQAGKEYPKATEYFVLPDNLREDQEFSEKLGLMDQDPAKPTRLPIMLLSNNLAANIVTTKDNYGSDGRLKCRATPQLDGTLHCIRLNTTSWEYEPAVCRESDACKGCAWYHRIRFTLPDCAALGYWQIATKSDNNRGTLLKEMRDLRSLLSGKLAGIDLMLTLTNERQFHVKVTDRQGKSSLMPTNPYLLHIEPGTSLRKLMGATVRGEVYDAEIIEESYDLDEEPVASEEPPINIDLDTGEIIEPVAEPETWDNRQSVLSACIDMEAAFPSPQQAKNFRTKTFLATKVLENMTEDELLTYYDALQVRDRL